MKKEMTKMKKFMSVILVLCMMTLSVSAHSGRTDSKGGHHDYMNKSGLGTYHYHCGGHPAHLHKNGVCPYKTVSKTGNVKRR